MKIYDCFMFFDEEMVLDLRLNILNKYVDKFVINEATYLHSGKPKKLIFDINKYKKFKDKIIYNIIDKQPQGIEKIYETDNDENDKKGEKLVNNSSKREHYQRECLGNSLDEADPNDIILCSDLDEIPNLEKVNFKKIKKKIVIFKQKFFFYKFNLLYDEISWYGTRACKKKHLINPQWLRDIKVKYYPLWRLDTVFSKMKYSSIHRVENGGWHFTNIKTPEDIEKKYLNFLHHQEYEYSGLKLEDIKNMVENNKVIYDHKADQKAYKWKGNKSLKKISLNEMPNYIKENTKKYIEWLEI
jgi:beta-1,4-mannosyl-glycoprotein beta-1,4-N-acetylglucosaminyltransferase